MEVKNFIVILLLITIPLILLILCYRNYAYNHCKNDMKCVEDKLSFNMFNLTNKLKSLNSDIKQKYQYNQEEEHSNIESEHNGQQIEGFLNGFGSWFSGSSPGNLPVSPGTLPKEDLMILEKKINDKNNSTIKSSTFPPKDVNGNSDDFYDSDNSELLGQDIKVPGKPYGAKLSNDISSLDPALLKLPEENKNLNKNLKSTEAPIPIKKSANLKQLLGKCQFFDGKCPDNYLELGNFSLHGVSSNSVLTCGNVQNTKPAKAVAQIKNNSIYEIHVLDQGHGFNPENSPKINIEGGNGHGATAEALIDENGFLKSIKIINPGYNYSETPNVLIDAPLMNSSCHLCCEDT